MVPDTDRRSLRSLRSDRDDSKERGVAFFTFVSLPGHRGKNNPNPVISCHPGFVLSKISRSRTHFHPFRWTAGPSELRVGSTGLCPDTKLTF